MRQLPDELSEIIRSGENITTEFKTVSHDSLPQSLFETICAMLNRQGGHIFLGINDGGKITGINPAQITKLEQDFSNLCNNSQKIFPAVYLKPQIFATNDGDIIYLYIYESSDVHRSAGRIYDRNSDGDYDITDNTHLVSQMYIRKSSTYIENKVFPYAKMSDLRSDLIVRARRMAQNNALDREHPWAKMSDEELIRSASFYEMDRSTGQEGINLAGLLLLGTDEAISSVLSYYRTDALLRIRDTDRYDDRIDIRTNLLESYDLLFNFVIKHTDDRFYLEDGQRKDIRGIIARELCANMFIHREYSNPLPARLIITKDTITTENASRPRTVGTIDLRHYEPYPKNPKIARFFKEIGLADELGSGFKKMQKYTQAYSGTTPSFEDGEVFRAVIPLNKIYSKQKLVDPKEVQEDLLLFISNHNGVTRQEINKYIYPRLTEAITLEESQRILRNALTSLRRRGAIRNNGSDKNPQWVAN